MSDLLIKGLDAPKKCNGCCMNFIGHCMANKGLYVGRDNLEYNNKPDWCPAMNIQPHGRLGDLDALESNLRHMAKYQHGERQQGILGCCDTIHSAPTIIPASGGVDNG